MADEYTPNTIEKFHASRESGSGCPETDGGAHYFAFIDRSVDHRICIDCGAPEQIGGQS